MKLLCTVFKILMCWKLCHETLIENVLRVPPLLISNYSAQRLKKFAPVNQLIEGINKGGSPWGIVPAS
jgi:hypothetical protein